jgi:hypothetical protein
MALMVVALHWMSLSHCPGRSGVEKLLTTQYPVKYLSGYRRTSWPILLSILSPNNISVIRGPQCLK